jgi:hyperosmotically inducible protein
MKRNAFSLLMAAAVSSVAFAADPNADNTQKNQRDRDESSLTPIDQSNEPADLKITAETRKMLVADDSLSANAKNVKVITVSGVVTLRGPVATEAEKAAVAKHAKMAGAKSVTNEIEVKQP